MVLSLLLRLLCGDLPLRCHVALVACAHESLHELHRYGLGNNPVQIEASLLYDFLMLVALKRLSTMMHLSPARPTLIFTAHCILVLIRSSTCPYILDIYIYIYIYMWYCKQISMCIHNATHILTRLRHTTCLYDNKLGKLAQLRCWSVLFVCAKQLGKYLQCTWLLEITCVSGSHPSSL